MLYDGKQPQDLTDEEIQAAVVYCYRMKHQAAIDFEKHDAGIQELTEEFSKRHGYSLEPDIEDLEPASREIN